MKEIKVTRRPSETSDRKTISQSRLRKIWQTEARRMATEDRGDDSARAICKMKNEK